MLSHSLSVGAGPSSLSIPATLLYRLQSTETGEFEFWKSYEAAVAHVVEEDRRMLMYALSPSLSSLVFTAVLPLFFRCSTAVLLLYSQCLSQTHVPCTCATPTVHLVAF